MNTALGSNLRRHRVAAGLSQEDLAERTGLSQTWISRLEKGAANPTVETLKTLSSALSIEIQALFEEECAYASDGWKGCDVGIRAGIAEPMSSDSCSNGDGRAGADPGGSQQNKNTQ